MYFHKTLFPYKSLITYRHKCAFISLGFSFPMSPQPEILLTARLFIKFLSIQPHSSASPNTPALLPQGCAHRELNGQPAFQMLANNVVIDNVNAGISTVLKKRPYYSTSEYNRKCPIKALFCVQSRIKTKQSLRGKMKKWNRNKTTD